MTLEFHATKDELPEPSENRFLICHGRGIGDFIGSNWAIMRCTGSGWWSEGGTEYAEDAPDKWAYLPDEP